MGTEDEGNVYEFMCTYCGLSHLMDISAGSLVFSEQLKRQVDPTRPCPNCGGELMLVGPKGFEPFYRTQPGPKERW